MFENNNYLAALERRKDDVAHANEYRRGSYLSGGKILIDELVNLLKSVRKVAPVAHHIKRHTPAPVSRTIELVYFHHFMHRNHTKHQMGLQGAK